MSHEDYTDTEIILSFSDSDGDLMELIGDEDGLLILKSFDDANGRGRIELLPGAFRRIAKAAIEYLDSLEKA